MTRSVDIDYFLLHKEGGNWDVINGGALTSKQSAALYGGPTDITIPAPPQ